MFDFNSHLYYMYCEDMVNFNSWLLWNLWKDSWLTAFSKKNVNRSYYPGTFHGKPKISTGLCFKNMKKTNKE